jgi:hypothetical protein
LNFTIGNQSPGAGHTDEIYRGGLAGISVYNAALTPAQIQAQYDAALVPEPSAVGLIGLVAALGGGSMRLRTRKCKSAPFRQ